MSFDFHRPGIFSLNYSKNWWHFTNDPVTAEQTTMEELFELGYVKMESWKWTNRFVRKYKWTKLGLTEYRTWKKASDARFAKIFKELG